MKFQFSQSLKPEKIERLIKNWSRDQLQVEWMKERSIINCRNQQAINSSSIN